MLKISSTYKIRQEAFGGLAFNRRSWAIYEINYSSWKILEYIEQHQIARQQLLESLKTDEQRRDMVIFLDELIQLGILNDLNELSPEKLPVRETKNIIVSKSPIKNNNNRYFQSPISVWWDITGICNLKCKQCYSNSGKKIADELDLEEVKKILEELALLGVFYIYFLGGEPFLRKDFIDILHYCRTLGLDVMINTNGWFVDKELSKTLADLDVRRVRVSIDGATAQTHDFIRGVAGSYERATNAVSNLAESGIYSVGVTPTIMHENINEANRLIDIAYDLGANEIQLVQLCSVGRGQSISPMTLDDYSKLKEIVSIKSQQYADKIMITSSEGVYEKSFSRQVFNGETSPQLMGCGAGRTCLAISPNGKVRACLLYQYEIADLRVNSFTEIWQNENNDKLNWLRNTKEGCSNCWYSSVCSGSCPMENMITAEQRDCFSKIKPKKE